MIKNLKLVAISWEYETLKKKNILTNIVLSLVTSNFYTSYSLVATNSIKS